MSRTSQNIKTRPEPIDERGGLKEAPEHLTNGSREKIPPPRLPSLTFPTNRLPQLDVEIVKRLPGVGDEQSSEAPVTNHNIDPSLPMAIVVEKTMYNLWEKTQTQTEVKWTKPTNSGNFSGMLYQIQIRKGDEDWQDLAENRQSIYRVYYTEGVALFGRQRVSQDSSIKMVRLRIRGIGEITERGTTQKFLGPWSEDVIFSIESTGQR